MPDLRIGSLVSGSLHGARLSETAHAKVFHGIQNRSLQHTHGYKSSRKWEIVRRGKHGRECKGIPRLARRMSRNVFLHEVCSANSGGNEFPRCRRQGRKRNERLIYRMSTLPDNHAEHVSDFCRARCKTAIWFCIQVQKYRKAIDSRR